MTPRTCCFEVRLRESDGDQFFQYGESTEDARRFCDQLAQRALATFQVLEGRWGNGRPLVRAIAPADLERDAAYFDAGLDAETSRESAAFFDQMRIRQLFPGWDPYVFQVALLLGFICEANGDLERASAYANVARDAPRGVFFNSAVRKFLSTRAPRPPSRSARRRR